MRFLVVNADDFGLTEGINRGIIEAHEQGIVTSASLMVRNPAAAQAAEYARRVSTLDVGLHVDLGEWRYRDGKWEAAYVVVDAKDEAKVRAEFERQLAAFKCLLGHAPTHVDSHQHAHQTEPLRSVLLEYSHQGRVPLRGCTPSVKYEGRFYGQTATGEPWPAGISLSHLVGIIEALAPGWTELGCHPGYADGLDSVYLGQREEELRVLCDPQIREALLRCQVQLGPFRDLNR